MQSPSDSLVSVILPVYNGARRFVKETIASVVGQTYVRVELLVIDDGSSDGSGDYVESLGVRVIRQENRGLAGARNAGLSVANGKFIALIDDDDLWEPRKIEIQIEALTGAGKASICTCAHSYFLEGAAAPRWFDEKLLDRPQTGPVPSTWLVRRAAFEEIGFFDEQYRLAEDLEWLARAADAGLARIEVPECLVRKRVHDSNLTGRIGELHGHMLSALRASVARKRAAGEGRE